MVAGTRLNEERMESKMSENIKRKLTSRKFWAAVVSFVTMLVMAFGVAEETATQVGSIIMAGATVIAYIIGEGMADAAGVEAKKEEE